MHNPDFSSTIKLYQSIAPAVDYWSLRLVHTTTESLCVRQGYLQPPHTTISKGAFISIIKNNGIGYAATSDLSKSGLKLATSMATNWAELASENSLINSEDIPRVDYHGEYATPVSIEWDSTSLQDKLDLLQQSCESLKISDKIVDWTSHLNRKQSLITLITSSGGNIEQSFEYITPGMVAVANDGTETQKRTGGGYGESAQGGLEQLKRLEFPESANKIAEEALQLLDAPDCPAATQNLLLMPSQMVLQIHESIGHPLELDRILGDERNYAGTSFVTPEMFGNFRYGSELLNITFDPSHSEQLASYAYDDDGSKATRTYIIRNGLLERPLGGACSQSRTNMSGVANSRACNWNRPPIDRMANLNLEPGDSDFKQLLGTIENGILMETNKSWSIDDSRNKFQFGCEIGKIIRDGELKEIVKNPNYRGISSNFWNNLIKVGDKSTFEISGTPNCGKGEPNQVIHVGHASPACAFKDIDVFGGS